MAKDADYFTRYGADILARTIERYWQMRGYVGIRAQRFPIPGHVDDFGVQSNIGPDGFPPPVHYCTGELPRGRDVP